MRGLKGAKERPRRSDRGGLRCCAFSATGSWLAAVSAELTVWRVCVSARPDS